MLRFILGTNFSFHEYLEMDSIRDIPENVEALCNKFGLPYVSNKQELSDVFEIPPEQLLINAMNMRDDRVVYFNARMPIEIAVLHHIIATAADTGYWDVIDLFIFKCANEREIQIIRLRTQDEKIEFLLTQQVQPTIFLLYYALRNSYTHLAKMCIRSGVHPDIGAYQIALNNDILEVLLSEGMIGSRDSIDQCVQKNLFRSLQSLLGRGIEPNNFTLTLAIQSGYYPIIQLLVENGIAITLQHVNTAIGHGYSQIARLLSRYINSH